MGTPRSRSATPSAFQKVTTASTFLATRLGTAEKPIVMRAHALEVAAVRLHDRTQHGVVGWQPGDAHTAPLEVARRANVGPGDHGGERALHDRADSHDVLAALARQAQVVDVHDRGVGAARQQELERVRGGRRRAHLQREAVTAVEPFARRGEHAGVHGVGLEVQGQHDPARAVRRVVVATAAREESQHGEEGDYPPHAENLGQQRTRSNAAPVHWRPQTAIWRYLNVQERGPSAYIAEFIGTLALVFFITAAVSLYVTAPTPTNPLPFIDFGVIGLVHVFVLFMLIQTLALASGAHFNPAVTAAMARCARSRTPTPRSTSSPSSPAAWRARC